MDRPEIISNARLPGESFEAFKIRRRVLGKAVRKYLRGRFVYISKVQGKKGVTVRRGSSDGRASDS